ncbi:MAG: peptidoglycan-N-acetylglucosamine deacetylase [bacterium]|jgi:peptidoglycan/xylan/chitin deacetylase (PgdA/CDA1 family)
MANPTVCLTFDFDAMSLWMGTFKVTTPTAMSRGEFGARVGVPRILDILKRNDINGTFYIPGHTVDTYPDLAKRILDEGHEIGHHGYLHESPVFLSEKEEREVLDRGIESIERATGDRPVGYRSPAWDLSDNSIPLLLEYGFEYDSSMMAQDFEPYRCRVGDVPHGDKAYEFGKEVDLVEFPVSWTLDDFPQMEFVLNPVLPGLSEPDKAKRMWLGDLDWMVRNVPGGIFGMTFHPQVIGRGGRMQILEDMIAHAKGLDGAKFSTVRDAVRGWKAANSFAG